MTIALLDINDSNLQLWHGSAHLQSPGYALLVDRQYRFGNPARCCSPADNPNGYFFSFPNKPTLSNEARTRRAIS